MAPMPELLVGEFNAMFPRVENMPGAPLEFSLMKGIGNSAVREGLRAFAAGGMESPQAAQSLLRLFAPVEGGKDGKNLWEQVNDAYTRADLRAKHKDDLVATNYFLLDSLANGNPELRTHGKTKPLTKETAALAKRTFEQYSRHAAKTLDPEDPRTVSFMKKTGATAKAAPIAALLAACAGQAVIVPPVYETPPAAISPIGEPAPATATKEPTTIVSPTKEVSPTPSVPEFFHGVPTSLDQFPLIKQSEIALVIGDLKNHTSLLTHGADPGREFSFNRQAPDFQLDGVVITCLENSGCAAAASFKVNARDNIETYMIVWEFFNKDGSRGYVIEAIGESDDQTPAIAGLQHFHSANGGNWLLIDLWDAWRVSHEPSWHDFWFEQPGLQSGVDSWLETGNIPSELENQVLTGGIQRFVAPSQ